ncbi:MAG: hypothetical protein IJ849_02645 [Selenomonadaceae bacterium]|nr:hypothetical protein [Selenomonadaceae bacterium]
MAINDNDTDVFPTGNNRFLVRGFKSRQKLMNHWREHGFQYLGLTARQYEEKAVALAESAVGGDILGHIDKDGVVIRYDICSNDFVKGRPAKGIFTMFKPSDGIRYYWLQKKEDLEHGGRA